MVNRARRAQTNVIVNRGPMRRQIVGRPLFPGNTFPNNFSNNAPGLGFDFTHFFAVNGGRNRNVGFRRGFRNGVGGGFILPFSSPVFIDDPQMAEDDSQAEESDPGYASARDNARRYDAYARANRPPVAPQEEPQAAPAQQPESSEYVFVKRDGGVIFAVAYSWDKGTLRYVTREGLRRSVARDAVDLDATQQFNEQRGLNFSAS
jgi:hypothetical protein